MTIIRPEDEWFAVKSMESFAPAVDHLQIQKILTPAQWVEKLVLKFSNPTDFPITVS